MKMYKKRKDPNGKTFGLRKWTFVLIGVILACSFSISMTTFASAADFSAGSGSANDPYIITTQEQLLKIDTSAYIDKNLYFKIANDITLTTAFKPLGTASGVPFKGHIDGDYHIIKNFTFSSTAVNTGFIRQMTAGSLRNIFLENVQLASTVNYTGALVGLVNGAVTINNCSAIGNVDVTSGSYVGGLFGGIKGSANISECGFNGRVGGINYVGGFAGSLETATIKDSFAVATVFAFSATGYAGGFLGTGISGKVQTSYSASKVNSFGSVKYIGGTSGTSTGTAYTNVYYDGTLLDGAHYRAVSNATTMAGITRLNASTIRLFAQNTSGFDTVSTWRRTYGYNNDYPTLFKNPYFAKSFARGSGTEVDPYIITNHRELQNLAFYIYNSPFMDFYFAIGNNITLSGEFSPIGNTSGYFQAFVDGRNYTISGLRITMPNIRQGLFGYINAGSTLKNIKLSAPYINVAYWVGEYNASALTTYIAKESYYGALVGVAGTNTVIEYCSTTGGQVTYNVNATLPTSVYINAGGLLGYLGGAYVNDCSSTTPVNVTNYKYPQKAGGFIGYNQSGTITRSSSTGAVKVTGAVNTIYVGGFAGWNYRTLSDIQCSSAVTTTGSGAFHHYIGGIAGYTSSYDRIEYKNCIYTGAINATHTGTNNTYIAGIAGYINGTNYRTTLTACIMAGTIKVTTPNVIYGASIAYSSLAATHANHKMVSCLKLSTFAITFGGTTKTITATNAREGTSTTAANLKLIATYTNIGYKATLWKISGNYAVLNTAHGSPGLSYFNGGAGTYLNPYKIATAQQLQDLRYCLGPAYNDTYWVLSNNIDLAGMIWIPIGYSLNESQSTNAFFGHFNGGGYTISNLTLTQTGTSAFSTPYNYIGLFGSLYEAHISNVTLKNPVINYLYSDGFTRGHGALTGASYFSSFVNCSVTTDGTVAASGMKISSARATYTGGMVGYSIYTEITNCMANINVQQTVTGNYNALVGGLVGYTNVSNIRNSYAMGNVTAITTAASASYGTAGGLTGYMANSMVDNCYAMGNVQVTNSGSNSTALAYAGGICGFTTGNVNLIQSSYATGNINVTTKNGDAWAGGIVGRINTAVNTIRDCVAASSSITITNTDSDAAKNMGQIGGNRYVGTATVTNTNNFHNSDMSIADSSSGFDGSGFPLSELKVATEYQKSKDQFGLGWDFTSNWQWASGKNDGFPTLRNLPYYYNNIASTYYKSGSGTEASPFIITTETELRNLKLFLGPTYNGFYWKLGNDITLTGEWEPIGYATHSIAGSLQNNPALAFCGNFDGGNYTIKNFKINNSYTYGGLFGSAYSAEFKNLKIEDCELLFGGGKTSLNILGALVGYTYRTKITNVHVVGGAIDIGNNGYVYGGGLAGYMQYTEVLDCSSTADIRGFTATGASEVGGLIGIATNNSLVERCYTNVEMSIVSYSTLYTGGLVGYGAGNSRIIDSYSLGRIEVNGLGTVYSGGLIGYINPCIVNNCYSGVDISVTTRGTVYGGSIVGQSLAGSAVANCIGLSSYIDISSVGARSVSHVGGGTLMSSEGNLYYHEDMAIEISGVGMGGTPIYPAQLTYGALSEPKAAGGLDLRWDLSNVWSVDPDKNGGLPFLIGTEVFDRRTATPEELEAFFKLQEIDYTTINDRGTLANFGLYSKMAMVDWIIEDRNNRVPGSGDQFLTIKSNIQEMLDVITSVNEAYGGFNEIQEAYYSRTVAAGNESALLSLKNKISSFIDDYGTDDNVGDGLNAPRSNISATQKDLMFSWIETLYADIGRIAISTMDGNGLKTNPFVISNQYQLMSLNQCVGPEYQDSYWIIENDIYITTEWMPIGTGSVANAFWGHVDGYGFSIHGLKLTEKYYAYASLFGYVTEAEISNINIVDPVIDMPQQNAAVYAGALAGYISGDSVISNCSSTGGYIYTANQTTSYVGGLLGHAANTAINGCMTNTPVESYVYNKTGGTLYIGGLGGYFNTCITNMCYSTSEVKGTVDGSGGYLGVGGLIGATTGQTMNSYATGNVYAERTFDISSNANISAAGGLIGYMSGAVPTTENSYATGEVSAKAKLQPTFAGGVVGAISGASTIENCAALNQKVESMTGYGRRYAGQVVGNSSWITGAGNKAVAIPVSLVNNYYYTAMLISASGGGGGTPQPLAFFRVASNISGSLKWDMTSVWEVTSGNYPTLRIYTELNPSLDFGVNGSLPESTRGQKENPFLITNDTQLARLQKYYGVQYKGYNWQITQNITLSGEWIPIGQGTGVLSFYGNLDGNGKNISGLKVTSKQLSSGLFGFTIYSEISNITIVTPTITNATDQTTTTYAGALVGYANATIIDNCTVTNGTVTSANDRIFYTGGMVGYIVSSKITNSKITGTAVKGTATSELSDRELGGLAGYSNATIIERCYSSASVTMQNFDTSAAIGGLVGLAIGEIRDSYSTGKVATTGTTNTGTIYAGGIAGAANGRLIIENCYSSSTIDINTKGTAAPTLSGTGSTSAGGIIGSIRVTTTVFRVEIKNNSANNASIKITGTTSHDIDYVMASKSTTNGLRTVTAIESGFNYYLSTMTLSPARTGGIQGTAKTAADLKRQSTYVGLSWNFTTTWTIKEGTSYPEFKTNFSAVSFFASGSGTQTDPFIITTATHLSNLRYFTGLPYRYTYWKINNNIALSGNWEPIGTASGVYAFNGKLDGNGKNITGLTITAASGSDYQFAGLFGYLERADIKDLNIVSPSIVHTTANSVATYAGALVGYANTTCTITNCTVTGGSVSSSNNTTVYTGGLAGGIVSSTVELCSSTATVTATDTAGTFYAGGLAGTLSQTTISRSYSTGAVTATTAGTGSIGIGGLAGFTAKSISDCYATGKVTATTTSTGWVYVGGLVGYSTQATIIRNSYTSSAVTISSSHDQSVVYVGGILGRTTVSSLLIENCAVMTARIDINSTGFFAGHVLGYQYATDLDNNFYRSDMKFYSNSVLTEPTEFSGTGTPKTLAVMQTLSTYSTEIEDGGLGWNIVRVWKSTIGADKLMKLRTASEYDVNGATPAELRALFGLPDIDRVTQEDKGSVFDQDSLTYKQKVAFDRYTSESNAQYRIEFYELYEEIDLLLKRIIFVANKYEPVYTSYLDNYDGITNVSQIGDENSGMIKNRSDLQALLTEYNNSTVKNLASYQITNINNAISKISTDLQILEALALKFGTARQNYGALDFENIRTTDITPLTSVKVLYDELALASNIARFSQSDQSEITANRNNLITVINTISSSVNNFNRLKGGTALPDENTVKFTDRSSGTFYTNGTGGLSAFRNYLELNFFTDDSYTNVRPIFGEADADVVIQKYQTVLVLLQRIEEVNNETDGYNFYVNNYSLYPALAQSTDKIAAYTQISQDMSAFLDMFNVQHDNLFAAQVNNLNGWIANYDDAIGRLTAALAAYTPVGEAFADVQADFGSALEDAKTTDFDELSQLYDSVNALRDNVTDFSYLTAAESGYVNEAAGILTVLVPQLENLINISGDIESLLSGVTVHTAKTSHKQDIAEVNTLTTRIRELNYYESRIDAARKAMIDERYSLAGQALVRIEQFEADMSAVRAQKTALLDYNDTQLDDLEAEIAALFAEYNAEHDGQIYQNMTAAEIDETDIITYDIRFVRVDIIYKSVPQETLLAVQYNIVDNARGKAAAIQTAYNELWTAEQSGKVQEYMSTLSALSAKLKELNRKRSTMVSSLNYIDPPETPGGNRNGLLLFELPNYSSGLLDLIADIQALMATEDYMVRFTQDERNAIEAILDLALELREEVETPSNILMLLQYMYDKLTAFKANFPGYQKLLDQMDNFVNVHWNGTTEEEKEEYNLIETNVKADLSVIGKEVRDSFFAAHRGFSISDIKNSDISLIELCYIDAVYTLNTYAVTLSAAQRTEIAAMRDLCADIDPEDPTVGILKQRLSAYNSEYDRIRSIDISEFTDAQLYEFDAAIEALFQEYNVDSYNMTPQEISIITRLQYDSQFFKVKNIYIAIDQAGLKASDVQLAKTARNEINFAYNFQSVFWTVAQKDLVKNTETGYLASLDTLTAYLDEINAVYELIKNAIPEDMTTDNVSFSDLFELAAYPGGLTKLIADINELQTSPEMSDIYFRLLDNEKEVIEEVRLNAQTLAASLADIETVITEFEQRENDLTGGSISDFDNLIVLYEDIMAFCDSYFDRLADEEISRLLAVFTNAGNKLGEFLLNVKYVNIPDESTVKNSDRDLIAECYEDAQFVAERFLTGATNEYFEVPGLEEDIETRVGALIELTKPDGLLITRLNRYNAELASIIAAEDLEHMTLQELIDLTTSIYSLFEEYNTDPVFNMSDEDIGAVTVIEGEAQYFYIVALYNSFDRESITGSQVSEVMSAVSSMTVLLDNYRIIWGETRSEEIEDYIDSLTTLAADLNEFNLTKDEMLYAIPAGLTVNNVRPEVFDEDNRDIINGILYDGGMRRLAGDITEWQTDPGKAEVYAKLDDIEKAEFERIKQYAYALIERLDLIESTISGYENDVATWPDTDAVYDAFEELKIALEEFRTLYSVGENNNLSDEQLERIENLFIAIEARQEGIVRVVVEKVEDDYGYLTTYGVSIVKNSDLANLTAGANEARRILDKYNMRLTTDEKQYLVGVETLFAPTGLLRMRLSVYNSAYTGINDQMSIIATKTDTGLDAIKGMIEALFAEYNTEPNFNMTPEEISAMQANLYTIERYRAGNAFKTINTDTHLAKNVGGVTSVLNNIQAIYDTYELLWTEEEEQIVAGYLTALSDLETLLTGLNDSLAAVLGAVPESMTIANVKPADLDVLSGYDSGLNGLLADISALQNGENYSRFDSAEQASIESVRSKASGLVLYLADVENALAAFETANGELSGTAEDFAALISLMSDVEAFDTLYGTTNDNLSPEQIERIALLASSIKAKMNIVGTGAYEAFMDAYPIIPDATNVKTDDLSMIEACYAAVDLLLSDYGSALSAEQLAEAEGIRDLVKPDGVLIARITALEAALEQVADEMAGIAGLDNDALDIVMGMINALISEYDTLPNTNLNATQKALMLTNLYDIEYYRAVNIFSSIDTASHFAKNIAEITAATSGMQAIYDIYALLWTAEQESEIANNIEDLQALYGALESLNTLEAAVLAAIPESLTIANVKPSDLNSLIGYASGLSGLFADITALQSGSGYVRFDAEQQAAIEAVRIKASSLIERLDGIENMLAGYEALNDGLSGVISDFSALELLLGDVSDFGDEYGTQNDNLSSAQLARISELQSSIESKMTSAATSAYETFIELYGNIPLITNVKTSDLNRIEACFEAAVTLLSTYSSALSQEQIEFAESRKELTKADGALRSRIAEFEAEYNRILALEAGYDTMTLAELEEMAADISQLIADFNAEPNFNMTAAELQRIITSRAETYFRILENTYEEIDIAGVMITGMEELAVTLEKMKSIRDIYSADWKSYQNTLAASRITEIEQLHQRLAEIAALVDEILSAIPDELNISNVMMSHLDALVALTGKIAGLENNAADYSRLPEADKDEITGVKEKAELLIAHLNGLSDTVGAFEIRLDPLVEAKDIQGLAGLLADVDVFVTANSAAFDTAMQQAIDAIKTTVEETVEDTYDEFVLDYAELEPEKIKTDDMAAIESAYALAFTLLENFGGGAPVAGLRTYGIGVMSAGYDILSQEQKEYLTGMLTLTAPDGALVSRINEYTEVLESIEAEAADIESLNEQELEALRSKIEAVFEEYDVNNQNMTDEENAALLQMLQQIEDALQVKDELSERIAALEAFISQPEFKESDYTKESFKYFTDTLASAKAVSESDAGAEQNAAALESMVGLESRLVNITALDALVIDYTANVLPHEENYLVESWAVFMDAFDQATSMLRLAKNNITTRFTQTDIDNMISELTAAKAALEPLDFRSELEQLLTDAKALDPASYLPKEFGELTDYIALIDGLNLDEQTAEQIIGLLGDLKAKIAALVDITEINAKIAEAEAITDLNIYTEETRTAFENALADAKAEIISQTATAASVAYRLEMLTQAIESLEEMEPGEDEILELVEDSKIIFTHIDYTAAKNNVVDRTTYVYDPEVTVYIQNIADLQSIALILSQFKNNLSRIKVFKADGITEILASAFTTTNIGTGMIINLYSAEGDTIIDSVMVVVKGDITGDGRINSADKTQVTRHINGLAVLEGAKLLAADINRDGKLNSADKTQVTRQINGLVDFSADFRISADEPLESAVTQEESRRDYEAFGQEEIDTSDDVNDTSDVCVYVDICQISCEIGDPAIQNAAAAKVEDSYSQVQADQPNAEIDNPEAATEGCISAASVIICGSECESKRLNKYTFDSFSCAAVKVSDKKYAFYNKYIMDSFYKQKSVYMEGDR